MAFTSITDTNLFRNISLEKNELTTAAIAGDHFESDERFLILEKNISNHEENYTRFLLIGNIDLDQNQVKNKVSSVLI